MALLDGPIDPPEYTDPYMTDCPECDGEGSVICEDDGALTELCLNCSGTGQVEEQECSTCGGTPCYCDDAYEDWKDAQWD